VTDREQIQVQPGRRLTAIEAVSAVYRMAFQRGATGGRFDDVVVEWLDLALPIVALFFLSLVVAGFELVTLSRQGAGSPWILVVAGVAQVLRFAVAAAVTWGLVRVLVAPERVWSGLLAYLWMEAALLQPWLWIVRSSIGVHDPWWVVTFFGYLPTAAMVFVAGRVMEMAFKLSSIWLGIFVALAGTAVVSVLTGLSDLPA
jgi:hypothetical protein